MKFVYVLLGLLILLCSVESAKSDTYIEIGKKKPCGFSATGCQDSTGWNGNYVMAGDIFVGTCKVSYLIEYYEKFCPATDPFLSTYSCQIVGMYILTKTNCNLSYQEILGIIYLRIWNNVFRENNVENIVCNVKMAGCMTKADSLENAYLKYENSSQMAARGSQNTALLDSLFKNGPVQIYAALVACESTRECCISHYKVKYDYISKKIVSAEKIGQSYPEDSSACDSAKSELGTCTDGCQYSNLEFKYDLMRGSELPSTNKQAIAYPNPTDGNIRFYIPDSPEGRAEFSLTNALGIVVYQETISVESSDFIKEVDFSGVAPGVYLYSFRFDEKTYSGTITINK